MLKATINVPGIEKLAVGTAERVLDIVLQKLGAFAQDRITHLANEALDAKMAKAYRDALTMTREKYQVTLTLGSESVQKLEAGNPSFDIKPGLLRGKNAKQGKAGPYADVPFSHSTSKRQPGQFVESRGPRILVKALAHAALATGLNHKAFAGEWSRTSKRRRIADMHIKPRGGRADMVTFRRVSTNSPADSWIYPQREGLKIFAKVLSEVLAVKDQVVADTLTGYTK
jgi:hypothetical protein